MKSGVAVIGGGAAGLAAAFAASASSDVTLIDGGAGATSFSSGAIDEASWDSVAKASRTLCQGATAHTLDSGVRELVDALGLWSIPDDGPLPLVATTGGTVRIARGTDRALLDLRSIAGHRVLLPRADRGEWDADALARAYAADAPRDLDLTFEAIDATVLRFADERRIAAAEIATRHDEESRLAWLSSELLRAKERHPARVAFLLGPWLGALAPRARTLSERVGAPVGEALSGLPGAPGLRFEAARDALLKQRGVTVIDDRVLRVDADGGAFKLRLRDASSSLRVSTLVLATGGLVGGGIVFDPPDHGAGSEGAASTRPPYRLDLEIDLPVRVSALLGTTYGPELDDVGWPTTDRQSPLEHIGLLCNSSQVAPGVFAAGDLVRARPRTILEAVRTGLDAGKRAVEI